MGKVLESVVAVILNSDGQVLAVTNRRHGGLGFPGGKCDEGEEPKVTLLQLAYEQLDLVIRPVHLAWLGAATYKGDGRLCHFFHVSIAFGIPRQVEEGTEPRWVDFETLLAQTPFMRAFEKVFPDGVAHLRETAMIRMKPPVAVR